ncbi:hypothetical protein CCACVL1_10667 [Corchorus capsularis]|uniref:Uncharacterized protein n=1 Tax=Corchorus capsularis TaxID=210143 RepID=A0A1R3IQC3_COCAP|nr:hypothetical protein CCACVL1_10667 [Corchorus capsularis]
MSQEMLTTGEFCCQHAKQVSWQRWYKGCTSKAAMELAMELRSAVENKFRKRQAALKINEVVE